MNDALHYELNYRALLPDDHDARILDLGCGDGGFLKFAHDLGYRNLTGVDRDEQAIASLGTIKGLTSIHAEVGPEFLARLGGSWDLIVAKQMIYYFDRSEVRGIVEAVAQLLAPGGRLVVEIFNGALMSSRFTELKDPGIRTAYTDLGLKRLLEWNGLAVDHIGGAEVPRQRIRSHIYHYLQWCWFRFYRQLLILERGFDDELPVTEAKSIIAVAHKA